MKKILLAFVVLLIASTFVFGQAALPATGKVTVEIFDRGSDGGRTLALTTRGQNGFRKR